jgi:putative transposase
MDLTSVNFPDRKRPAAGVYQEPNKPILVFTTVCTKDRHPWLASSTVHHLLRTAWSEADDWLVGRYVVMPDHLHLFATPSLQSRTSLNARVQFWNGLVRRAADWPFQGEIHELRF